jgi:hypothetical protein
VGETEAHHQLARVDPGPLSERAVTPIAAQDGNADQGENGGERMTFPAGVTNVGNLGEHIDQWTALRYHAVTSLVVFGLLQPNRLPQVRSPDNN